jgi:dTDP-4-dehydrorhamnose reductase
LIVVFGAGGQLARELEAMAGRQGVPLSGVSEGETDIADPAAVARAFADHRPTLVVNAAAYTAVDRAESEPDAAMRANAEGPAVLAAASAQAGVPMVQISTDFVFDGEKREPYREDDPVAPLNVYGRSKAMGEAEVRRACPEHLIIRTAWLFSEYGGNFLATILKLARERDTLNIVADQHGSPTATDDLAGAILAAAAAVAGGATPWGTYHFAGSGSTTWHGLAAHIVDVQAPFTGRRPKVNAVTTADYPTPARRPKNAVLDSDKFAGTFGVRATAWPAAIERTIARIFAVEAPA